MIAQRARRYNPKPEAIPVSMQKRQSKRLLERKSQSSLAQKVASNQPKRISTEPLSVEQQREVDESILFAEPPSKPAKKEVEKRKDVKLGSRFFRIPTIEERKRLFEENKPAFMMTIRSLMLEFARAHQTLVKEKCLKNNNK